MRSIASLSRTGNRTNNTFDWKGNFQSSSPYPSYVGWYVIICKQPDIPAVDWQNATNRTAVHSV